MKDWATRTPDRFSWKSALTALIRSRASEYAAEDRRRNTRVARTSTGTGSSATTASDRSVSRSATVIPMRVNRLTTAVANPVWRKVDSASTSVVIRVMIRPASSRS